MNHEPDMASASILFGPEGIYIDVNCKHCGRSGCFGHFVKTDEVDW